MPAHAARVLQRRLLELGPLGGVQGLAAAGVHVLLTGALCRLELGVVGIEVRAGELDPARSHPLRVGHVDAVIAHALGELQGSLEGLVLLAGGASGTLAVVGAAAGAEPQCGDDRGSNEW